MAIYLLFSLVYMKESVQDVLRINEKIFIKFILFFIQTKENIFIKIVFIYCAVYFREFIFFPRILFDI